MPLKRDAIVPERLCRFALNQFRWSWVSEFRTDHPPPLALFLRVDMESGEIRVMVVHSRTTHITEQPERTVLWVTQMQATDETE